MSGPKLLERAILAGCLWPALLAGCHQFEQARFNAGDGVDGDSILAVPFAEPKERRWYCESTRGSYVIDAFKGWVRANADPNFPEGEETDKMLRVVRDWEKEEITIKEWKILAKGLEARYLLVGEIHSVRMSGPRTIGILDAAVEASYRVIDLEQAKTAFERKSFIVKYDEGQEPEVPMLELGADTRLVEKRLLARLGQQIGRDLYGYYPGRR